MGFHAHIHKRKNQMDDFYNNLKRLNKYERGYIAGIIDGEGSICIITSSTYKKPNKINYLATMSISNQDKKILNFIHKKLKLPTKISLSKKQGEKNLYAIRIYGKDMITIFLKFMMPYFQSKKTHNRAKIMLNFCKAKTTKEREKLYLSLRQNYHYKRETNYEKIKNMSKILE